MDTTTLYQHSTLADLTAGLFSGTLPVSQLLQHGNTGIGTGDGLDGELIILDGIVYQVTSSGKVNKLQPTDKVPFATVHFANYAKVATYSGLDKDQTLERISKEKLWQNIFYSFALEGTFKYLKVRAVCKQEKPYSTLLEASKEQAIFVAQNISGKMIGHYSPKLYHGVAVGGFHYHFISDDHSFGGHVLDFQINQAELGLQAFETFQEHFPVDSKDFMDFDYNNLDNIAEQINSAEK
ncbi:acetolactate decarboxylase [Convivina intestini]|uniref:acetolactate decarboxylase n=1 Tax=Convivina intestini TaxID=1505726 RepID=UPI00200BB9B1|nr:acetolactate decarboxylase [Convivina intestini]CAH1851491.1 Alpha-acetolactate decarboxylase [Convivina intestini]